MAARKRIFHDENTRTKIQTSQIINRLEKHINAKPEVIDGQIIYKDLMTQSQVTAALGLLKKTLPDLSSVELKAEATEKRVINAEPRTIDQWETEYSLESSTGATESTH